MERGSGYDLGEDGRVVEYTIELLQQKSNAMCMIVGRRAERNRSTREFFALLHRADGLVRMSSAIRSRYAPYYRVWTAWCGAVFLLSNIGRL